VLLRNSALFRACCHRWTPTGMNLESNFVNDNDHDLYARALLSCKRNVKSVCLHIIINVIGNFQCKYVSWGQWTSAYDKFYDFGVPYLRFG
jgi:hypothetical protein